jgi:GAF domain-containing protein
VSSPTDYAAALAAAARTISQEQSLDDTLATIATSAARSVPGFDHVGISIIGRQDRIETKAATDSLVLELDRLQYEIGQGPCVSAMRETPLVVVAHARHDQRWPDYMPHAVRLGLRSQLAVRIFLDKEGSMGGLNLYSTSRDSIDPDAENIADLFAAHAALVLQQAREVAHLHKALESRTVIGQAVGLVMERYGLDSDRAFAFLLRASSHGNLRLRDVASELVAQADVRGKGRPE